MPNQPRAQALLSVFIALPSFLAMIILALGLRSNRGLEKLAIGAAKP